MMIITIDGPTASGKSTVARELAKILGFHCLSTGALYRGLAYSLLEYFDYSLETLEHPAMQDLQEALASLKYKIDMQGCGTVFYKGNNIMSLLKDERVSQGASIISTQQFVRDCLNEWQRVLADDYDVVVEGRDSGSIVFPNAQIKFFLTASDEVRARRWQKVQLKYDSKITIDQALEQIKTRDTRDRERSVAPLVIPENAIIIDSSDLSAQETINAMLGLIEELQQ